MTVTISTGSVNSDSSDVSSSSCHSEDNVIPPTILSRESRSNFSSDSSEMSSRLSSKLTGTNLPSPNRATPHIHHDRHQGMHHPRDIMCLKFNQENSLFACSTDSGLRIYNIDPLMVKTCLGEFQVRIQK
jgi:hypothetical protein